MDKRQKILSMVEEYHQSSKKELPTEVVPVSGKVYDSSELKNLVEASLDGWWTEGRWTALFESGLKKAVGARQAVTVNSGSSANLVAMKTLTSIKLQERRLKPGDEVITLAAGFPTTVNPIIQCGAVPVFIDVEMGTYNADVSALDEALSEKTKALILAHTIGNPFKAGEVRKFCDDNGLWLIEDNCDALGAEYKDRKTGTFGHLSTLSFYPAHHITTAEGGAVLTDDPMLYRIARSIRDWGRDCWCPTGKDDSCGKRFGWKLGGLPFGYDHKYTYSEIGYNLKMTDLQAALGVAQLEKLDGFIRKRRENFSYLHSLLSGFKDSFIMPEPTEGSEPSWFGFPLTIKDKNVKRHELMAFLAKKGVGTRQLFAGDIRKQPYFLDYKIAHRSVGGLENTGQVMEGTFWLGVFPALEKRHLDYVETCIGEFLSAKR